MKRLFILFFLPFLPLLSLVSDGSIITKTTPTKETVPVSAPPSSDGFEWVDLGLSVMWASCNLGSSSPSDYGGFAAWGEVESKDEYTWKNYRYRLSGDSDETIKFSKYNTKSQFGTIDRKTRLDPSDDAANVIVGKRWRLPTEAEWEELLTQCHWQWGRAFGKSYIRVFSYKTKQAIILPAQGYCKDNLLHGQGEMGLYWSSSTDAVNPREAFAIAFNKERKGRGTQARYYGAALRPVYDPVTTKGSISFSSNPAGAAIWLEDDTGKTTPAVIDNLTPTTYKYRLHYDGYETVEGKITVSPGQRTTVSQNLTPSSPEQTDPSKGSIKITSKPSGARIMKGVYPLSKYTPAVLHNVEPGKQRYRLVLKGYPDKSFEVLAEAGKIVEISIELDPLAPPAETRKQSPTSVNSTSNVTSSQAQTPPETAKKDATQATMNIAGHPAVDMGLSVKWATTNVGASKPEEYGDYYAWGETRPKRDYSWSTLKYCKFSADVRFSKYNTKSEYGSVDNKTRLDFSDDAARANWGGSWRMPTDAEWTELRTNCTWTWTTEGGKNGYRVTSKTNGNSIFLPAAGGREGIDTIEMGDMGGYWSSSLESDFPDFAWYVQFISSEVLRNDGNRMLGCSIRPVSD